MKIKLLAVVFVAVVVGFSSCGGKKGESSACDILSFKLNGIDYEKGSDGKSFYKLFGKPSVGQWETGCPTTAAKPVITLSPKASFVGTPNQDTSVGFGSDSQDSFSVTYTIKAEDGTQKTWTVRAERAMTVN